MNQLLALSMLVLLIYNFSVPFYTFYGIFKSQNEYFCRQRRAGSIDYQSDFTGFLFNFSRLDGERVILLGINNSLAVYNLENAETSNFTNFGVAKTQILFNNPEYLATEHVKSYQKNESYFKVDCVSDPEVVEPIMIDAGDQFYHITSKEEVSFNKFGYFSHSLKSEAVIKLDKNTTFNKIRCTMVKAQETCATKIETTNMFALAYICFLPIILLTLVLSRLSFKRYVFRRFIHLICAGYSFIKEQKVDFCNPIDGNPVKLKAGDKVYKLVDNKPIFNHTAGISHLKDLQGEYFFNGEGLLIINSKNKKCWYRCVGFKAQMIRKYFFDVSMDAKLCCTNDKVGHYYSTYEIIDEVMKGKFLDLITIEDDAFVLDVKEFEMNYLTNNYSMKNIVAKYLLEHNWKFFGGEYNMDCLEKLLKGKNWSMSRPSSVGAVQWRRYRCDYNMLLNEVAERRIKLKDGSKMTKALEDTLKLQPEDLIVQCIPKIVEVKTGNTLKKAVKKLSLALDGWEHVEMPQSSSIMDKGVDLIRSETAIHTQKVKIHLDLNDCAIKKPPKQGSAKVILTDLVAKSKESFAGLAPIIQSYKEVLQKNNTCKVPRNEAKIILMGRAIGKAVKNGRVNEAEELRSELKQLKEGVEKVPTAIFEDSFKEKTINFLNTRVAKIRVYNVLLDLLNEDEKRENEINEFTKVNTNTLMQKCLKSKKIKVKSKKKKSGKSNDKMKSKGKFPPSASNVRTKRGFKSGDFELNLTAAISTLNGNPLKTEKIRSKTKYSLISVIKKMADPEIEVLAKIELEKYLDLYKQLRGEKITPEKIMDVMEIPNNDPTIQYIFTSLN